MPEIKTNTQNLHEAYKEAYEAYKNTDSKPEEREEIVKEIEGLEKEVEALIGRYTELLYQENLSWVEKRELKLLGEIMDDLIAIKQDMHLHYPHEEEEVKTEALDVEKILKNNLPSEAVRALVSRAYSEDTQSKLIQIYTNAVAEYQNPFTYPRSEELLSTPFLSRQEKRAILTAIIPYCSGTESIWLLKNQQKLLTQELRAQLEARVEQTPYTAGLQIPSIYEASREDFKDKKVEFVVHSLFDIFGSENVPFDAKLWEESGKDALKYVELFVIQEVQLAIEEVQSAKSHGWMVDRSVLPYRYLRALDLLKEYDHYRECMNNPEAITIFVVSRLNDQKGFRNRNSELLSDSKAYYESASDSPEESAAYIQFINQLSQGARTAFFIEDTMEQTGKISEAATAHLQSVIPRGTDAHISGAYDGQCVGGFISSIENSLADRLRFTMEMVEVSDNNTVPMQKELLIMYKHKMPLPPLAANLSKEEFSENYGAEELKLPPSGKVTTLEEVRVFFDTNKQITDSIEDFDRSGKKQALNPHWIRYE